MTISHSLFGRVVQHVEPDWRPLLNAVGNLLASWFMWVSEIELSDGTRLHAYKHAATRHYLHLDATGHAFEYLLESQYRHIALTTAVVRAFVGWERAAPSGRDLAALRGIVHGMRAA